MQDMFLTETAAFADVVLPASGWGEKDGTVSVRKHSEGDLGTYSIEGFAELIENEINKTLKSF